MASYNPGIPTTVPRPAMFAAHMPLVDPTAPAGTFASGTKIQVGSQKVVIQKYFSEGGFAHVYLVKMPKPIDGTDIAILKRVAVPDKEHLANMRTEVETMKKLKGHRPIVTYYDSHASQLKGGGYEVFLLMEFCNGGGLIDFMNTRLQNRLTEPEILKIFSDVAEGVACMHYLKPPLLHRDLKVENVLITTTDGVKRFKLCDFGSTAPPRPAATTPAECRLIEDDVQKHTTLQYRSPEMIDVYRKQPIDEKSDIWALGVLLYKLCYYTTPFEAQGQLAILNASFKFPAYPVFSDKLKKLITYMLKENPKSRPNVYQVLREACLMQGIGVPIKDIYAGRTQSESRRNQQLPSPEIHIPPPVVGAVFSPPAPQQQAIPDVVPMRRGRPVTSSQGHASKPSPSPMRGTSNDPFAALDSKSPPGSVDDISSRFPSLDQFSLMHNGGKFDFDATSPTKPSPAKDLGTRVTEKLADDAFAVPANPAQPIVNPASGPVSRAQKIISSNPELQAVAASPSVVYQPTPTRTINSSYVSQGTMTSPTPPIDTHPSKFTPSPVYRFPADHHRSTSLPRNQEASKGRAQIPRPDEKALLHPSSVPRNADFTPQHIQHASSSRPSLEGGRPSSDFLDPVARAKSSNSRPRPSSAYVESHIDYLREKESRPSLVTEKRISYTKPSESTAIDSSSDSETNIESHVDFLKTMEDGDTSKKDKRRSGGSSHKHKRSSLPSMSLSGTKNLLAGKFGDAFKRFEHNANHSPGPRTPSPLHELERRDLTPIAGSEATDGRSDDGNVLEDMDGLAPEQRREIERRRLSMEERRVANAAAEYRRKIADKERGGVAAAPRSIGGVTRAASIQNKVKNLLDESSAGSTSPRKTAEGYGRFTHSPVLMQNPAQFESQTTTNPYLKPTIARKPIQVAATPIVRPSPLPPTQGDLTYGKPRSQQIPAASPAIISKTGGVRPSAPPKPMHLNSISTGPKSADNKERDDYVRDFSNRFPSLDGIGLVVRDIDGGSTGGGGGSADVVQRKDDRDWDRGGERERTVRTREV